MLCTAGIQLFQHGESAFKTENTTIRARSKGEKERGREREDKRDLFVETLVYFVLIVSLIPAPAAAAKSLQSCPTLCDPIDGSPPGSPVPGILQARTLEWVAISFSSA